MKSQKFYIVFGVAVLTFLFINAFTLNGDDEKEGVNKGIIKFSHQFHMELTDCESCHSAATEAKTLSDRLFPTMDDCAACHDVEDDEMCTQCHYEEVYEPLIQSESELIFDHSLHTSNESLECQTCHKGLDEVDYSFESENVLPGMDVCYTCHNDQTVASNACESCHTSTADLLPEDHKTMAFMDNHKFVALSDDENCVMCHDNSFCETCHVATNMIGADNSATDFYTPYSPHTFIDNTKQQQLTTVHSLDYVYSHGIDAKGKTNECQTCHETETFCADCHNAGGGDYAVEGFVPVSHKSQDFVILGIGSGGGQHAVQARRVIASVRNTCVPACKCYQTLARAPNIYV